MRMLEQILRYRFTTSVIFVLLVVTGISFFMLMPKQKDPDMSLNFATVVTTYPGASPLKVEQLITNVLEKKIDEELADISLITSTSQRGASLIHVELEMGVDYDQRWMELKHILNNASEDLPDDAHTPSVITDNKVSSYVLQLYGEKLTWSAVEETAEHWQEELSSIPGVKEVEIDHLPDKKVYIDLDLNRLNHLNIPYTQVLQSIRMTNNLTPGGSVSEDNLVYQIQMEGEYRSLKEIEETIITYGPASSPIRLGELAKVYIAYDHNDEFAMYTNGQPAISLNIFFKEKTNIVAIGKDVEEKIKQLELDLPEGIELFVLANQGKEVGEGLYDMFSNLGFGMFLVVLVLFFTLGRKSAFIVSLAIPLSFIIALIPTYLTGVAIHEVSLAAFIIALGMLVDNSIVVNDNIQRHVESGTSLAESAVLGTKEVLLSIFTATLTTISSFLPFAFLPGLTGEFVISLPLVVSFALLSSFVVAAGLVPMLRTQKGMLLKEKRPLAQPLFRSLSELYKRSLTKILTGFRPVLVVLLMCGLTVGLAAGLFPRLYFEFFPPMERNQVMIDVDLGNNATLAVTKDAVRKVEAYVSQFPEVEYASSFVGRTAPAFVYNELTRRGVISFGQVVVTLAEEEKSKASSLAQVFREELKQEVPGALINVREFKQGPPIDADVSIRLQGGDIASLRSLAADIKAYLYQIEGIATVTDNSGVDSLQLTTQVKDAEARRVGITPAEISQGLRLMTDGLEASTLFLEKSNEDLEIILRTQREGEALENSLEKLFFTSTQTGASIPYTQVAELTPQFVLNKIAHYNQKRTLIIDAFVEEGVEATRISAQLRDMLREFPFPDGYTYELGGEDEEAADAYASFPLLIGLVLLLITFILAIQFQSLVSPIIIAASIFLSIGGAVLGLYVTNSPVAFMSILGFCSLMGIVVNNAIVLIDFIRQAEREGKQLQEAIIQAGQYRLRPIILTTATTVFGLLPLAVGGGLLFKPMAVVIMGGLIYSTMATLFVVPALYYFFHNKKKKGKMDLMVEEFSQIRGGGSHDHDIDHPSY